MPTSAEQTAVVNLVNKVKAALQKIASTPDQNSSIVSLRSRGFSHLLLSLRNNISSSCLFSNLSETRTEFSGIIFRPSVLYDRGAYLHILCTKADVRYSNDQR